MAAPTARKKSAACKRGACGVFVILREVACRGGDERKICIRAPASRAFRNGRLENGERFPHVLVRHVVQNERAADSFGNMIGLGPRDHEQLRSAPPAEKPVALKLSHRFSHGRAVHAELPRKLGFRGQAIAIAAGCDPECAP